MFRDTVHPRVNIRVHHGGCIATYVNAPSQVNYDALEGGSFHRSDKLMPNGDATDGAVLTTSNGASKKRHLNHLRHNNMPRVLCF